MVSRYFGAVRFLDSSAMVLTAGAGGDELSRGEPASQTRIADAGLLRQSRARSRALSWGWSPRRGRWMATNRA